MSNEELNQALQTLFQVTENFECNGPTRRAVEASFRYVAEVAQFGEQARAAAEAQPEPHAETPADVPSVYPEDEPIAPLTAVEGG